MKFNALLDIIIHEIEAQNDGESNKKFALLTGEKELDLAREIIKQPENGPKVLSNAINEKYDSVLYRLRASYLSRPEYRRTWIAMSKDLSKLFLIESETDDLLEYKYLLKKRSK